MPKTKINDVLSFIRNANSNEISEIQDAVFRRSNELTDNLFKEIMRGL